MIAEARVCRACQWIARAPSHDPEGRLVLNTSEIVCFVATARPTEAKHFYQEILGLPMLEDGPVALVFDANGTEVRVQKVQTVAAAPYTLLGWYVRDVDAVARRLGERGVALERYDGLLQDDELGIWTTPDGARVAVVQGP
jgi:catechol 2,3-dioxygenase-like lactoylglutathione lyase family enzyme